MLKSNYVTIVMCRYLPVSGTIIVAKVSADWWITIFIYISEINNTQRDNTKDIGVVILKYNLIEYSNNYSKMSGSLLRYYRDQLDLNSTVVPDSFSGNSTWFKFKQK